MATTKTAVKDKAPTSETGRFEPVMRSRDQRVADAQALRDTVSRTSHAAWKGLAAVKAGRVKALIAEE